jgi:acyl-coenzyme A thioesterase PaaI-like protein
MDDESLRSDVAEQMRDLGHSFVECDLSEGQLDEITAHLEAMETIISNAAPRTRVISRNQAMAFNMPAPPTSDHQKRQLLTDSFVSGGTNPHGLGGIVWRENDAAVMEVTLGSAFEGAPGRAHGGIVAALFDETMGLVLAMNGVLAYTVRLDISYLAPTPVHEPITARAWLSDRSGRKLTIVASLDANDTRRATASALFIEVDTEKFLESVVVRD